MDLGYTIGDRVIQTEDKVIGEVIKMYYPTACKQQTMILCDDGRKYHAPSDTFIKVSELEEQIVKKIKDKPPQLAMAASMPLAQDLAQPLLVPHDYRNIKVADMLINASKKRTNCMTGEEYDKYIFEKWQLRQIAEHLLVYCNHNGEDN